MSKFSESKILFWLSLAGLSVKKQADVVKAVGGARSLWDNFTKKSAIVREIVGEKHFAELSRFHSEDFIDTCIEKLSSDGISLFTALNPLYPTELLQSEVNAPSVFYYKGDINLLSSTKIAIVGTRACTSYGKEMTKRIATTFAENGITVVSGLATGVDTYAHESAIDAGGKTIAVLANGFNNITPVSGIKLIDKIIASGGLVITEYKPTLGATKFTFPERNRIISGLCKGVVVVEAGEKSGALITARHAIEQGREVFAVPGNITSSRSIGCNNLIFEGANMIRNGEDVLEFLSISIKSRQERKEIILDKDEKKLYSLLEEGCKTFDELIENSGILPMEMSEILLKMELNGIIIRTSSNSYEIKS